MKTRTEIKVGLFVLLGLALAALLIVKFNKGSGPMTKTYHLRMQAKDVSGVIPGSFVLMAGVRIGSVERIELDSDSGSVMLVTRLLSKYRLRTDSKFMIKQSGFIGDQYIAAFQGKSDKFLDNDAVVQVEEPFDLGEVARSTGGLVKRVDTMVVQISNAVDRVDKTLLAGETLTNLAKIVANFHTVSESTLSTLRKVETLIDTNAAGIHASVTNAQSFSAKLDGLATELRETLATNRTQLTASIKNIENATAKLDVAMGDVNAGKGLVGALIKNEQLATDMSLIMSNLQVLSSNVNNKGLWGVLRKPKVQKK
ncbi:MAG TPA: MlaD family protein [Verrucomicrobiae bacterium]|nr:MlaD family protein [Verrucomicrobiae bacterium]